MAHTVPSLKIHSLCCATFKYKIFLRGQWTNFKKLEELGQIPYLVHAGVEADGLPVARDVATDPLVLGEGISSPGLIKSQALATFPTSVRTPRCGRWYLDGHTGLPLEHKNFTFRQPLRLMSNARLKMIRLICPAGGSAGRQDSTNHRPRRF